MGNYWELISIKALTSVFFYLSEKDDDFYDEYINNFAIKYASFNAYFIQRKLHKEKLISSIKQQLFDSLLENIPLIKETTEQFEFTIKAILEIYEFIHNVNTGFEAFNHTVVKSVEDSENLTNYMGELEKNTIDIKGIIDVISDIADQTNLLVLMLQLKRSCW